MPVPDESAPPSVPVRISEVTLDENGLYIRGSLPHGFEFPPDPQLTYSIDEAVFVSREDLRRLADRAQVAGPEMDYVWAAYRAAGLENLTAWQAFVAGIGVAAEWRRG